MRYLRALVPLLLLLSACGPKHINKQVQDAVRNFDNLQLTDSEIEVVQTQEMSDHAVAEVKIRTALKLVKKQGHWVIDEVRIGDRRWEKADHIRAVLNQKRAETTKGRADLVVSAIERYTAEQGRVPAATDFRDLVAKLSPQYLEDPTLLDAWSNPFSFRAIGGADFEVRSAGADGRPWTPDDIVRNRASVSKAPEAVKQ